MLRNGGRLHLKKTSSRLTSKRNIDHSTATLGDKSGFAGGRDPFRITERRSTSHRQCPGRVFPYGGSYVLMRWKSSETKSDAFWHHDCMLQYGLVSLELGPPSKSPLLDHMLDDGQDIGETRQDRVRGFSFGAAPVSMRPHLALPSSRKPGPFLGEPCRSGRAISPRPHRPLFLAFSTNNQNSREPYLLEVTYGTWIGGP